MILRKIYVIALSFLFSSVVLAEDTTEAMFGLQWNMSVTEFKNLGIALNKVKGDQNLEFYLTSSVPKPLSDIEKYSLIFSEGKLVKIVGIGKDIDSDPAGKRGKERFEVLKNALQDKYGAPSRNYQNSGKKLYRDYDEFYQCLAYSGCGLWVVLFETPNKVVGLELKGLRRGAGYINITVEAVPGWNQAIEKKKSSTNRKDSDAL